ncbi:hypothetical protein PQX77_002819 [Marasmius sp. AFHP31]|nr:hypothetical protein PQX77_002819 [Marasmius sp. AFHP31]
MAAQNIQNGPGIQNNHNAMDQNINYGDQTNVGRDFVRNYTVTSTKPHRNLWDAVSGVGASHTAEQQFARGSCLKGTRETALEMIHVWTAAKGNPICWLTGAAGVGKSAIAMTVAKSCEKDSLVSSFFFFRSDPKRNNPSGLILTIAHGLVSTSPFMRILIEQRISDDPKILEAQLEDQFRELIITPTTSKRSCWRRRVQSLFAKLSISRKVSNNVPNIVIIDGLDECSDEETQLRILSIIQSAFRDSPHFPLRFLICSRPESWIQEAFVAKPLYQLSQVIRLDDSLMPNRGIMQYYRHHFQEIVKSSKYEHVRFPEIWPSEEDLEILVRRSCGQFVYAATVIKFVKLAFSHPVLQLRIILDNTPSRRTGTSPYHELDALYHVILNANPDHKSVLLILAAIFILPSYMDPSPACIELLLGLPSGGVALTLRAMYSVLNIRGWGDKIGIYHTSFREFLTEQYRSRDFYIDIASKKHDIAGQWLRNLSVSKMATYSFDQFYAFETKRFFTQWIKFCISIPAPTRELLDDLRNVDLASVFSCQQPLANTGWQALRDERSCLFESDAWGWPDMFAELYSWVEKYVSGHADCNDKIDLKEEFRHRFLEYPKYFHLARPPDVSLQDRSVYRAIILATECIWPPHLAPLSRQAPLHLAECTCDHSGKKESDDPKHLDFQEACFQLVKTFVFEATKSPGLYIIFANLVDSSLLRHCRIESRLISLCRTYFELAGNQMRIPEKRTKKRRTTLLEWIGTFPPKFAAEAEALKSQVTDLFPAEGIPQTYD